MFLFPVTDKTGRTNNLKTNLLRLRKLSSHPLDPLNESNPKSAAIEIPLFVIIKPSKHAPDFLVSLIQVFNCISIS